MSDVERRAAATMLPVATTHLHILRTTVAAIASQEIASLFRLPEPYWATITALPMGSLCARRAPTSTLW